MITRLWLPFPPTANNLFSGGLNTKRRFPSAAYKAWQQHAGYALLTQPDRHHRHTTPVEVVYTFCPPDKRRRDVFNLEKPVSDLLVKHGILADDSLIRKGTVQWGDKDGVDVLIMSLG